MEINISPHLSYHELVRPGQLASMIIEAISNHRKVTLVNKEPVSMEDNHFFEFLDSICEYHNYDKSCITILTGNLKEKHTKYNIGRQYSWYDFKPFMDFSISSLPWTGKKQFGMFIGRLNETRMHAITQCYSRGLDKFALLSHHQEANDVAVHANDIVNFLKATNRPWTDIGEITARSDIGPLLTPPIVPPKNIIGWEEIYKNIPIEVVCETAESANVFSVTEKLFRPIKYRRPFLLIASPGIIQFLKETTVLNNSVDFRFFEDVIPANYDNFAGKKRVDMVFDILEDLIYSNKIFTLLKKCQRDIDHNYAALDNLIKQIKNSKNTLFTRELNEKQDSDGFWYY